MTNAILQALQERGEVSYVELMSIANCSRGGLEYRMHKLRQEGYRIHSTSSDTYLLYTPKEEA